MSPSLPTLAVEGARKQRTALVVDDVDDMLDLLEIALNAADFAVLRASSADDAAQLFAARVDDIDLLMTDVRVGSDSGLELARQLLAVKPSLHVLAISGFALDGTVISGTAQIEFLPKPFSTSDLKKKLRTIFVPPAATVTVTVSSSASGTYSVSARSARPTHGRRGVN